MNSKTQGAPRENIVNIFNSFFYTWDHQNAPYRPERISKNQGAPELILNFINIIFFYPCDHPNAPYGHERI